MTAEITVIEPLVEALVLFGSRSRGDYDENSDTDLAVFAHATSQNDLVVIKERILQSTTRESPNLSVYSVSTAEMMASVGSLFLWHLKLEGKVLFKQSTWIDELLKNLPVYAASKASSDIRTFEDVLDDVKRSLDSGDATIEFEAATLFSVLRNLGMIIATVSGNPSFGRLRPIHATRALMGYSFSLTDFEIETLFRAKMAYSRNALDSSLDLSRSWCQAVRSKLTDIAEFARSLVNERIC